MSPTAHDSAGYGWLHRNSFYSATHLSGFGFIYVTQHRLEIGFWYLVIVVCTAVLFSDIYELVVQFAAGKTSTDMRLHLNTSIDVPALTVCVQARLPDYNWGFPEYRPLSWRGSHAYPFWSELRGNMSTTPSASQLLTTTWPYIYLPLLQRYVAFMFYSEQPHAFPRSPQWRDYKHNEPETDDAYFTPGKRYPARPNVTSTLVGWARSLGVSDRQLVDKLSDELLQLFALQVVLSDATAQQQRVSLTGRLQWLDGERSCFAFEAVRLGEHSLLTVSANMRQVAELESQPAFYRFDTQQNSEHVEESGLELHVGGSQPPPAIADVHVPHRSTQHATIALQAQYISIKNCSSDVDMSACRQRCRSELIGGLCACRMLRLVGDQLFWGYPLFRGVIGDPLFHGFIFVSLESSTTEGAEVCTADSYLQCLQYNIADDAQCRSACRPSCEQRQYRLELKSSSSKQLINQRLHNHNIVLKLAFRPQPFALFVEQSATTWQNFLGDVGGIFDFWLGVNVMGVIHVFVYALKRLLHATGICRHDRPERRQPQALYPADEQLCEEPTSDRPQNEFSLYPTHKTNETDVNFT